MPQAYEAPATVRPQRKPEPARTAKPLDRTPRPYSPAAPGVSGHPAKPATAAAARTKKSPTVAGPAVPPASQPFASTAPSTAQPATSMPYLPPASPYTPTGSQGRPTNVVPDDSGTVTARIPGNAPVPGFDRFGSTGRPPSTSLPPAQPLGTKNPIDGFILDSFGRPGMQVQGPRPSRSSDTPASSVFGQIGQDVQNLGAGIKDTFSSIVPGR
jgi:putative serine protease PepD